MRDLVGKPQFLLEALDNRGIARQFRTDHLQRNRAVQLPVFGFVDRAHAAFAQHCKNLVAPSQHGAVLEEIFVPGKCASIGGRRRRPSTVHGRSV